MSDYAPLNDDTESRVPPPEGVVEGPRGRSCFFWGCLILVLLTVLVVVGTGGCVYIAWRQVDSLFEAEGVVFEEIPTAATRVDDIRERLLTFREGVPEKLAELVLSPEELNILLLENPDPTIAELARFQRVGIKESSLTAEVSFPVDWGISQIDKEIAARKARGRGPEGLELVRSLVGNFEGRFLNGAIELGLAVEDGRVRAQILGVVFAGGVEWGPEDLAQGNGRDIDDAEEKISRALDNIFFEDAAGTKLIGFREGKLVLQRIP